MVLRLQKIFTTTMKYYLISRNKINLKSKDKIVKKLNRNKLITKELDIKNLKKIKKNI